MADEHTKRDLRNQVRQELDDDLSELRPGPMSRWRVVLTWLAVVCAAGAWGLSLDLTLATGTPGRSPLLCTAAPDAGCNAVVRSQWAYVAMGGLRVPVSLFGMGYFALLAVWFALVGAPRRRGRGWHVLLMLVVAGGVWESVTKILLMANVLHMWCWTCLVAHGLNSAIALIAVTLWWGAPVRGRHPDFRLGMAAALAGLILFAAHVGFGVQVITGNQLQQLARQYRKLVEDPQYVRWNHQRQAPVDLPLPDDRPVFGEPDAPHVVQAFVDPECGKCAQLTKRLKQVLIEHRGRVRIVYRHYPLGTDCNPEIRHNAHPHACEATRAWLAAYVAGGKEGYRAMRDALYARQRRLGSLDYAGLAAESGMNAGEFASAMASAGIDRMIARDIALGDELGLEGVPMVYVDGRRFDGWRSEAAWSALLAAANEASAMRPAGAGGAVPGE